MGIILKNNVEIIFQSELNPEFYELIERPLYVKRQFSAGKLYCVWCLLVMVNLYHHTEISVFYVLPCVYQVIANGAKNVSCVSLNLNYSFEITVCEKRISLGSTRKIRLYQRYIILWAEYFKTDTDGSELYLHER